MIARLLLNMTISNAAISRHCSNSPFLIMQNSRSSLMLNKILFANSFSPLLRSNILNDIKITKSTFNNILSSVVHSSSASISYSYQVFDSSFSFNESLTISHCYFRNIEPSTKGPVIVYDGSTEIGYESSLELCYSTFYHCTGIIYDQVNKLLMYRNTIEALIGNVVMQNRAITSSINETSLTRSICTPYLFSLEKSYGYWDGINVTYNTCWRLFYIVTSNDDTMKNMIIAYNNISKNGFEGTSSTGLTLANMNYFGNQCQLNDVTAIFTRSNYYWSIQNSCFNFDETIYRKYYIVSNGPGSIRISDCQFNTIGRTKFNERVSFSEQNTFGVAQCQNQEGPGAVTPIPIAKDFIYGIIGQKKVTFEIDEKIPLG